jgi:hypothetical protein
VTKEGINEKKMLKDIRNQYLTILNKAKEYAANIHLFGLNLFKI